MLLFCRSAQATPWFKSFVACETGTTMFSIGIDDTRSLFERLDDTFQQRIIRLQLENKNLREAGEGAKEAKQDLDNKAHELEVIEKRIEDQKSALEEKEKELKVQLLKIEEIETNMAKQRNKIKELHDLYDDGVEESCLFFFQF
jgi:peptidoglycan hydrolase CwlO-like protein